MRPMKTLAIVAAAAAGRGVQVGVVVDGFGSKAALPALRRWLGDAGVQLVVFRPLDRWWRLLHPGQLRRLHQKLCVVDGTHGFVGGINLIDDRHDLHHGWTERARLDFAVAVQGPVVAQMVQTARAIHTRARLGADWRDGKLHRPLTVHINGDLFGRPEAGVDMTFSFPRLIAHAARTRALGAGTIIGSGTVSNKQGGLHGSSIAHGGVGYCCLAEVRMYETIETGKPQTGFLKFGDTVRIGSTEAGIDTTGTITEIADKAGTDGLDDQHIRIVIAMETQAGSAELLNDLPVRVTIPISSTGDTKVLVVPVAAVTLAADGTSRVDIETDPQADTKTVTVEPGISTDGVVEVAPVEPGALNEGDRVVVGTKQEGES